ncbi:MAG: hypothetical protein KKF68_01405 [Nanoarchaeota archaeon]|nr:hypothetical protein [Nanoarchaeota archaeon]
MKKTISKTEVQKEILLFFSNLNNKTPKDVKKIKRLAMAYNFPLRDLRKTFCKKCLNPYKNPKIRIKKKIRRITCERCGNISRWKIKK